jgi:hypothetical protein
MNEEVWTIWGTMGDGSRFRVWNTGHTIDYAAKGAKGLNASPYTSFKPYTVGRLERPNGDL